MTQDNQNGDPLIIKTSIKDSRYHKSAKPSRSLSFDQDKLKLPH
jgi:hypothetical protein